MPIRFALLALLAAFSKSAAAQVYSWRVPGSGETRISNVAPAWYNAYAAVVGPRIVVTLNGVLVDDTSLPLAQRQELLNPRRSDKRGRPRS